MKNDEFKLSGADIRRAATMRKSGIEIALYTRDIAAFEALADSVDRLYFGCEFCDECMPALAETKKAKKAAEALGKGFTLVTPMASEAGIKKIKKLAEVSGGEVVVNDIGALWMLRNIKGIRMIAGRALVRQKSDPRLASVNSAARRSYFAKTALHNSEYAKLLKEFGIERAEMDMPAAGAVAAKGFETSVYMPYVFLTVSGDCHGAECETCGGHRAVLRSDDCPAGLLVAGKVVYYRNARRVRMPEGVSRIVLQDGPQR